MADEREIELSEATVKASAVDGARVLLVRGVLVRGVMLVGGVIFASLLTPGDLGLVALGLTVIAVGNLVADGGLGAGLIRRAERPSTAELQSLLGWQLALTAAIAAIVGVVAGATGPTGAVVALMCLSLPFAALQTPGAIVLERSLLFRRRVLVEVVEVVVWLAAGLALVLGGLGVWGLALATVARSAAGAVVMLAIAPVRVSPRLRFREIKGFLGFGARFQAVGLTTFVCDQGLNVLVLLLGGLPALGLWSLAYRVMQVPGVLLEALWRVSYPGMARLRDAGADVAHAANRIIELATACNGLVLAVIASSSVPAVSLVLGGEWVPAAEVLLPACMAILVAGGISAAAAGVLYAHDDVSSILRGAVIRTFVWLGGTALLWSSVGVAAVGWAWLAAGVAEASILGLALSRVARTTIRRSMAPGMAAFGVATTAGHTAAAWAQSDLIGLLASVGVTTTMFVLTVSLFRRGVLAQLRTFAPSYPR